MFTGMSLLRKQKKKEQIVTEEMKAREAYLAKMYGTGGDEVTKKKKKKKKSSVQGGNIRIVDETVTGFDAARKPQSSKLLQAADDDEEEDVPTLDEMAEKLLAEQREREKQIKQEWVDLEEATGRDNGGDSGLGAGISPARRARHDSPDMSPPRRARHDSPDMSPPRRARHDSPDMSPPRRAHHDSRDLSPPRRARHDSPDMSPPRRARHDSPDMSPPRRARHDSPDMSPPRRARHDSPDISPPRRAPSNLPDVSPPRMGKAGGTQALQRTRHDSPDASPPRRRAPQDPHHVSLTGPTHAEDKRRVQGGAAPSKAGPRPEAAGGAAVKREWEPDAGTSSGADLDAKRRKLMSDGTVAGMVSGREVVEEMERKRAAERERFAKLDSSVTGKGAATVYRDRQGRVVDVEELKRQQEADRKPKHEAPTWGAGLKQIQDAEEREREMEREAAKPFARSKDDAELDALYRERVRFGDPMAHLVKKKAGAQEALPVVPDYVRKQMKKRGFVIPVEVPPHSWLNRKIGPPINRYGIQPGKFWDGVDRSNGFENELFAMRNARSAAERERQMWSQADM